MRGRLCVQWGKMSCLDICSYLPIDHFLKQRWKMQMDNWDKNDESAIHFILSSGKWSCPLAVGCEEPQKCCPVLPIMQTTQRRPYWSIDLPVSGEVQHKGENKTPAHEGRVWLGNLKEKKYCRQWKIQAERIKGARDWGRHSKQELSQECFSQMYLNVFC